MRNGTQHIDLMLEQAPGADVTPWGPPCTPPSGFDFHRHSSIPALPSRSRAATLPLHACQGHTTAHRTDFRRNCCRQAHAQNAPSGASKPFTPTTHCRPVAGATSSAQSRMFAVAQRECAGFRAANAPNTSGYFIPGRALSAKTTASGREILPEDSSTCRPAKTQTAGGIGREGGVAGSIPKAHGKLPIQCT